MFDFLDIVIWPVAVMVAAFFLSRPRIHLSNHRRHGTKSLLD